MTFKKKSRRERYIVRDDVVQVTGLAVCFGFALHTYGSATVAKQQYPPHRSSLKTVHRTVLLTLRPSQVQVLIYKKAPIGCLFGAGNRTCRLLRLRLAYLWLGDRCKATVPASPLFTKNSPPDCFINAQTFTGSSPNI